jgi:hypothetical protein
VVGSGSTPAVTTFFSLRTLYLIPLIIGQRLDWAMLHEDYDVAKSLKALIMRCIVLVV